MKIIISVKMGLKAKNILHKSNSKVFFLSNSYKIKSKLTKSNRINRKLNISAILNLYKKGYNENCWIYGCRTYLLIYLY